MSTANLTLQEPEPEVAGLGLPDGGGEEMLVNLGAGRGTLRMILRMDGERVLEAEPRVGEMYCHAEKIGESLPYREFLPYTDRLDCLTVMNNNHAWAMTVEKLAGIEIPLRAEYIRVMAVELNRIASHLMSLGDYGMESGAFRPFLSALREREYILDLFERLCGVRVGSGYIQVGGVAADLAAGFLEKISEFLDYFEPRIDEYEQLLSSHPIFIRRTAGIGVVSKSLAIGHALSGPMIRGSGIPWDLRKDKPYSIYDRLDFDVCIGSGLKGRVGDCWDRYWVRVLEMRQCIRILRQCIEQMPEGEFRVKLPQALQVDTGEISGEYENPRGQLGFFIESQGGAVPYRVKIRGPSFVNLAVAGELCRDVSPADIPAIIGSIDVVLGEVDR